MPYTIPTHTAYPFFVKREAVKREKNREGVKREAVRSERSRRAEEQQSSRAEEQQKISLLIPPLAKGDN